MAESDDNVPGVATWRDYTPDADGDGKTAVPDRPANKTAKAADNKEG